MTKMNDVIDTMILVLNHIECVARPCSERDLTVNVLSLRINNMIAADCDVCEIVDMLDAQDTWA